MGRNNNRKNPDSVKWIVIAIVLLFTQPILVIPIAVISSIGYVLVKVVANAGKAGAAPKQSRQEKFDDCPQPFFCFHKDKGEHHVRRGREIDPWDRPDIDISKYQRRQ